MAVCAHDNPFRVERLHALPYQAPGFVWGSFLARAEAMNYRGAITGPHGAGKTTLMLELAAHLEARGFHTHYLFLNEESKGSSPTIISGSSTPRDIILLDGAEQLSWIGWRRFLRQTGHARGVIITTHQPGRLPVLHMCRPSIITLQRLLRELLHDEFDNLLPRAEALYRERKGNMREVLFGLFDYCADNNEG